MEEKAVLASWIIIGIDWAPIYKVENSAWCLEQCGIHNKHCVNWINVSSNTQCLCWLLLLFCDKIIDKEQLKRGKVSSGSQSRRYNLAVGKADYWLHCIPSPEAESEQEKGTDYKTSRATPSDIFPSAWLTSYEFLNFPKEYHQLRTKCSNTRANGRHLNDNNIFI